MKPWKLRSRWEVIIQPRGKNDKRSSLDDYLIDCVVKWFRFIEREIPDGVTDRLRYIEFHTGLERTRAWKILKDIEIIKGGESE